MSRVEYIPKSAPEPLPERCCGRCVYWARARSDSNFGDCRRHAPTAFARPMRGASAQQIVGMNAATGDTVWSWTAWPRTQPHNWCGEHRPVATEPAP